MVFLPLQFFFRPADEDDEVYLPFKSRRSPKRHHRSTSPRGQGIVHGDVKPAA